MTLQNLISAFLSNDGDNFINTVYHSATFNEFYFNNEIVLLKQKGKLFIVKNSSIPAMVEILNCLPEVTAIAKNNTIYINGIEWDGQKTNIELFI